MSTYDRYEKEELEKVRTMIKMAKGQSASISMNISGVNPSMSFRIEAYVLEKFLKEEL